MRTKSGKELLSAGYHLPGFYWSLIVLVAGLLIFFISWKRPAGKDDGIIRITLLQINDVYEISPLDEGKVGGLARVATVRRELAAQNPNTFTLLAGDFVSPSAIGTLKYDDTKIGGRQMVSVLNAVSVDLVTFGNHEFDLSPAELQKCIDSSGFDWVSSNVKPLYASGSLMRNRKGKKEPLPSVYRHIFKDNDGTKLTVGFFGLTLETEAGRSYIHYDNFIKAAGEAIEELNDCDFIIALTHMSRDSDIVLAKKYPRLKMIIGGHEHVHSDTLIGNVRIVKADANVKTVYEHFLEYNKASGELKIDSRLKNINDSIEADPAVNAVVDDWNLKAHRLLEKKLGQYKPCDIIASLKKSFDGTEQSIRYDTTALTFAIGQAMKMAVQQKKPDCALYNSGSIRIDDMLRGDITIYDVFRVLPYSGSIQVVGMRGDTISLLLKTGFDNKGKGCFLQYDSSITLKMNGNNPSWYINGQAIRPDHIYKIAINDFLLSGLEQKMDFLAGHYPAKQTSDPDLRDALVAYLKSRYGLRQDGHSERIIPCY